MFDNERHNLNHQCLLQIGPDTTHMELAVMSWFAAGHEILWIPIYEVADTGNGIGDAMAELDQFGGHRLIRDITELLTLPIGIKGWLFPAHLDDTDVVVTRTSPGEVTFGPLIHPATGQRITYRYPTEAAIGRQALYFRAKSEL